MEYVSTGDLIVRWNYTRQGINVLMKKADFPEPVCRVSRGKLPIWELPAIEAFEKDRPELHSEGAKVRKQKSYFLARRKGPKPVAGEETPLEDWLSQAATGEGRA